MNVVGEAQSEEDQVGGVWCVACVENGTAKGAADGLVRPPPGLHAEDLVKKKISLWNRFEPLSEGEELEVNGVGEIWEETRCTNIDDRFDSKTADAYQGVRCVGSVDQKRNYRTVGRGLITIDSGAEESCWPEHMLPEVKITKADKTRNFVAANGAPMKHYGEKLVKFRGGRGGIASMKFQVSDVTKPLASVARIVEQGNIVQIGPREEDCFILSVSTGRKIPIERKGGTYVMDAEYVVEDVGVGQGFPRPGSA